MLRKKKLKFIERIKRKRSVIISLAVSLDQKAIGFSRSSLEIEIGVREKEGGN